MNVHDYATRASQRQEREAAKPCPNCGHEVGRHFELPFGSPDYKALDFHCNHEDCSCVLVPSAR